MVCSFMIIIGMQKDRFYGAFQRSKKNILALLFIFGIFSDFFIPHGSSTTCVSTSFFLFLSVSSATTVDF
jgi:hypothetical protein